MKTIKQIADSIGVDKQRVYRFIKKNNISESFQEANAKYYDETSENKIIQGLSQRTKSPIGSEAVEVLHEACEVLHTPPNPINEKDAIIKLLQEQLRRADERESKHEQERKRWDNERLELTSKIIEQSNKVLAVTQKAQELASNAQHLHAMEKDDTKPQIIEQEESDKKKKNKGFLSKLFVRGDDN